MKTTTLEDMKQEDFDAAAATVADKTASKVFMFTEFL